MDIQNIGRLVMLLLGAVLIVWAAIVTSKSHWGKFIVALAMGGLLVGTGTFGLPFMDSYKDYFDSLINLTTQGDEVAYTAFFDEVAAGDIPDEVAKLGLAYTLERPLPDMATSLEKAIDKASGGSAVLLDRARQDLEAKESAAADLVKGVIGTGPASKERIENYDPTTRRLMVRPLETLPPNQRQQLRIDRPFLQGLRQAETR